MESYTHGVPCVDFMRPCHSELEQNGGVSTFNELALCVINSVELISLEIVTFLDITTIQIYFLFSRVCSCYG